MKFGSGERSKVLEEFLQQVGGFGIIDGGLATQLESHGANLNDPLWSATCLITTPHLIRQVHEEYLEAGAEVLITASYQATIQGLESKGLSTIEGEALLRRSIEIACEARDNFWKKYAEISDGSVEDAQIPNCRPVLVAASVGSYGAYLADGSEYSGDYGPDITLQTLKEFHRRRVQVLADSGADLLAFETIPNKLEAQAYAELLEEDDIQVPAWFSFNSKDGVNVVSGDSMTECASLVDLCKKVVAIGINCTPPCFIHGLIISIQKVTKKPILVYPNSGETYDAVRKEWVASTEVSDADFVSYVRKWQELGASLIGGCCRTTPGTIKAISRIMNKRYLATIEEA
ncbi:hypothetical protein KI387_030499 [Taxus chinensis]|uniref:Hcy-binding domain-containing protein n=1 Tax=Taxus chinensis TaxID=29808 RepID=A0AA38CDI9_TAXCH|nr:hypothetical protein KI387_030499 [Taxus chinensis]